MTRLRAGRRSCRTERDTDTAIRVVAEVFTRDEVSVAADGSSGLDLVLQRAPDVVLVDVGLPEIDGCEVARQIRATPEGGQTRLIALTGYGGQEDRRRSLESGFDSHLVKPVDPACLISALGGAGDTTLTR